MTQTSSSSTGGARLRHRRGRQCGSRARRAAHRGPRGPGAAAGGRARGRGRRDLDPGRVPGAVQDAWDWNYTTTEQKQLHNRRAYWPRMKALGGCSSMNAMIYIRGNAADYDAWRDEYGAAGWGYDDVLPYFVRAEGNTRLGAPYHGQDGPLHVEDRRYTHELTDLWVESAVSAGMKPTDDFNGAEQEGAGLYQVTCRNGRRWSVERRPTSSRCATATTSTWRPAPSRPGSSSRATAPPASPTASVAARSPPPPRARCCSAAVPSTARTC